MNVRTVVFSSTVVLLSVGAESIGAQTPDSEMVLQDQIPGARPHPEGLNVFREHTRSPSSLLYPDVWRLPPSRPIGESGWMIGGGIEAGIRVNSGSDAGAAFTEYGGWDDGIVLQRLRVLLEQEKTARYVGAAASSGGEDAQSYRLEAGRYGRYAITAYFDATPHRYSTTARVLWKGIGSDTLTLPDNLTVGDSTLAQVRDAFESIGNSSLSVDREAAGVSFQVTPSRRLRLFADFTNEERDGARAFGGTFSYPGHGQVMETVEPIDHTTTNLASGFVYQGARHQLNLRYSGSLFRNHDASLTWENPGLASFAAFVPPAGRMALAPDNDYHNLKLDYGTDIDWWRGRLTATASYARMSQDEELLPPTISDGVISAGGAPIDLSLWNVAGALSRSSADARIDHVLGHLRIVLQPRRKLRVKAEVRVLEEDNDTDYRAVNPITGQYGYVALDGGLAGIIPTRSAIFDPQLPGSRVRIRNVPYEKDTLDALVRVDYRFSPEMKFGVALGREEADLSFRERGRIEDDIFEFDIVHSGVARGTLRLGYEFRRRDGDTYNANPYENFYSSSLPEFTPRFAEGQLPHTLDGLRKFDLADSESHAAHAKLLLVLTDASDLSLTGRWKKTDFQADFGLQDSEELSLNAEWSHQIATASNLYLYYSLADHERAIANINDAGPVGTDASAGGSVYPLANAWSELIDEENQSIGGGFTYAFDRFTLDLRYTFTRSESRLGYQSVSASAVPGSSGPGIDAAFPGESFELHQLSAAVDWYLRDDLGIRFFYRYEKEDLDDFHFSGLLEPVVDDAIYLLTRPENFSASTFGAFLQKSF